MDAQSANLLSNVLALPVAERAQIATELLASLDDITADDRPEDLDRIWASEMSRRSQQIAAGEVQTETWDDVLQRVADNRRAR